MKEIALTHGHVAMVDDEDYELLNQYSWGATHGRTTFYATRIEKNPQGERTLILMHRQIMKPPKGLQIDHINGNGLCNKKGNLRIVTVRQNSQNRHSRKTSKYPGVSWDDRRKGWIASVYIDGSSKYLGKHETEQLAYEVYCAKLKEVGEKLSFVNL